MFQIHPSLHFPRPSPGSRHFCKKPPWFHLGVEFETNIWALVQNLDGTMESPLCELKPATHVGTRLTTHPSPPHRQRMGVRRRGWFLLKLPLPTLYLPVTACKSIQSRANCNAPATFTQGWDSISLLSKPWPFGKHRDHP